MHWEAIGAIGEVMGAAGVIATLAFLAYQLIQTRVAIRSSAYQSYSLNKRDLMTYLASEGVLSIFLRGLNEPQNLAENDRFRFHQMLASYMFFLQTSHRMWGAGQITDEDWESDLILLRELKGSSVFSLWWPACKRGYDRHFAAAVDSTDSVADLGYENFVSALEERHGV